MLNLRSPTRDGKGNVIAGADIATRWGPMTILVSLPESAIQAGQAAVLTSGLTYGAQALANSVSGGRLMAATPRAFTDGTLRPAVIDTGSRFARAIPPDQSFGAGVGASPGAAMIAENASRLSRILADPYYAPIEHTLEFQGKTVGVSEAAIEIARDPNQSGLVLAKLAQSQDPIEQSCMDQILAAGAVRAVMGDAQKLAIVKGASEAGYATAIALRQAVAAARLSDMKSDATAIAKSAKNGDKKALEAGKTAMQKALSGDAYSVLYARMFCDAFSAAAIDPLAAAKLPQDQGPRDPVTDAPVAQIATDPLAGLEGLTPDEIERIVAQRELAKPPAAIRATDVKPSMPPGMPGSGSVGPAPLGQDSNVIQFRRGA